MQTAKQQADGGSQVGLIFGWTADAQVGPNVNQFKTLEAVEGYDGNHYVEAATNYTSGGFDFQSRRFFRLS